MFIHVNRYESVRDSLYNNKWIDSVKVRIQISYTLYLLILNNDEVKTYFLLENRRPDIKGKTGTVAECNRRIVESVQCCLMKY